MRHSDHHCLHFHLAFDAVIQFYAAVDILDGADHFALQSVSYSCHFFCVNLVGYLQQSDTELDPPVIPDALV